MSIWNDPSITFKRFAEYVSSGDHKAVLQKIWAKKTKGKTLVSEVQPHELSSIIVSFQKQCIKSLNPSAEVKSEQLQDAAHLVSDWIVENKLSGIPLNDEEDYNAQTVSSVFKEDKVSEWIAESAGPLQSYIESKSKHDPALSHKEIADKNKRMVQKHPSLAHLFAEKLVKQKQIQFATNADNKTCEPKSKQAQHVHELRKSRAMLYFNHSEVGYETTRKCNLYKDAACKEMLIQVEKGELVGGNAAKLDADRVVQLVEPIAGYALSADVKQFDLDSSQWKFLQRQQTMSSTAAQSLVLRLDKEDLFLSDDAAAAGSEAFSGAYNENEDEKQAEEEHKSDKWQMQAERILKLNKKKRSVQQVVDLWIAGFNLHDCSVLKESYAQQVTSKQFVNQELTARDPVLQCLRQMFEASDDVGLEVTNTIIQGGQVILEFRSFGTKKEDSVSNSNPECNAHLMASHPTKNGLPCKVVHGVGIFEINKGEIVAQRLFWDQDQQWFSDMNVIKMPQSSTLSHFLYKHKMAPILNLTDQHMESSSSHSNGSEPLLVGHEVTVNEGHGDADVIYEMSDEMSEILALRGLNMSDLREYNPTETKVRQNKQKQLAQAMFWIAVGAMFVFVVPKYLGKPRR